MPVYDSKPPPADIVRGGVRIPRSSARTCRTDFAKLLKYVDPGAQCGFGFEGAILQPGSMVTDAELWPSDDYPRVPVLLEAALVPSEEPAARRRMEQLYILWRYDAAQNRWTELGRARSASWQWAVELRSLAVRAIEEQRSEQRGVVVPGMDLGQVLLRLSAALDRELKSVDDVGRWQVLGILHDELAGRVAAIGARGV